MSVMTFTSDFYSGLQSVLFPSVSVSDSMNNLLVRLNFFSVSSFSVECYIESGALTLVICFTRLYMWFVWNRTKCVTPHKHLVWRPISVQLLVSIIRDTTQSMKRKLSYFILIFRKIIPSKQARYLMAFSMLNFDSLFWKCGLTHIQAYVEFTITFICSLEERFSFSSREI